MSVEISAENRQEYQAWTPVEEDLEGLPKNIYDVILQMRVDCSTTDRNRMPYYGAVDDIDEFTDIPYIDDGTRAHQLDIYIPHDAIMCAARNLPVYIDVHADLSTATRSSTATSASHWPDADSRLSPSAIAFTHKPISSDNCRT